MINKKKILLTGCLLSGILFSCFGQKLEQYKTPSHRLIYIENSASYLVPHTARSFENAMRFHRNFWDYTPSEPTSILFNDFSDYGNGGTNVIPWNMLNISVAPFDYSFGVIPSAERMQWLMDHELTHQVMCDKAAGSDIFFRKIFGGKVMPQAQSPVSMAYSFLTTPRWYSPRWYHEGIAVFMETWMSGGIGRTLGGYDEMIFRTMIYDSAYFYRPVGLQSEGTTIDFQVGVNAYLYGTRFVSYLAKTYGTDKLKDFYSRSDSSKLFFARQFKQVYEKPLAVVWEDWISFENYFQQENIEKLQEFPVTTGKQLTPKAWGSAGRTYYSKHNNTVYSAVNYPGKMAHIAATDLTTGEMKTIAPVVSPKLYTVTSMAFNPDDEKLFICNKNSDWRGLECVDIKTGKRNQLIRFSRTGDLVFNTHDKCIWGIQTNNGRSAIVRIAPPYKTVEVVYTPAYTLNIFNLDISHDGTFLSATLSEVDGFEKLVLFNIEDLLQGKKEYRVLYDFEDSGCSDFVFDETDTFLYGTSYYTGASNVFRVNVKSGESECLTNAVTGFFRPLPLSADTMLVLRYTSGGMIPEKGAIEPLEDVNSVLFLGQEVYKRNPEVEQWMLPPVSDVDMDSVTFSKSSYRPFKELRFASAYPTVEGYKNLMAWGYQFMFMDPLFIHSLQIKATYSPYEFLPEKERLHLGMEWHLWKWSVSANWNKSNFYDLFGPTKVSRKGYSVVGSYHNFIRFQKPLLIDYKFSGGVYGGLDRMPGYQNVEVSANELYYLMGNFHVSHLRKSLGAVEAERGFDWNLYTSATYAAENIYPQLFSTFDAGTLLPIRNTTFWLRTAAGMSFNKDENSSFNNYYFGGFGNNWIDYQAISRYRETSSFPGLILNEAGGNNFAKVIGELNLKPLYFKKLGFTWLYVTYSRLTVFGGSLYTSNQTGLQHNMYYNSGAQLDFNIVAFSLLKTTLSLGAARAWRDDGTQHDELMISLKIM